MKAFGAEGFEYRLYEGRMVNSSLSCPVKVLVVDDNRDIANILCYDFNRMGFIAKAVYGEAPAMERITRLMPDLIFCDIGLPGKGGYNLAHNIRSDRSLDHIFLVALTYFHQEWKMQYALEHGFDAYVSLPIMEAHLEDIRKRMKLRRLRYQKSPKLVNAE